MSKSDSALDTSALSLPQRLEFLRAQKNMRTVIGLYVIAENMRQQCFESVSKGQRTRNRLMYTFFAVALIYGLISLFVPSLKLGATSNLPIFLGIVVAIAYATESVINEGEKRQLQDSITDCKKAESMWLGETGYRVPLHRIYYDLEKSDETAVGEADGTADIFWLHDSKHYQDAENYVLDRIKDC